jgi:hypothetical protein
MVPRRVHSIRLYNDRQRLADEPRGRDAFSEVSEHYGERLWSRGHRDVCRHACRSARTNLGGHRDEGCLGLRVALAEGRQWWKDAGPRQWHGSGDQGHHHGPEAHGHNGVRAKLGDNARVWIAAVRCGRGDRPRRAHRGRSRGRRQHPTRAGCAARAGFGVYDRAVGVAVARHCNVEPS